MNLVLGLLILGGSSVSIWAGITNPEGGLWNGLKNVMAGAGNTPAVSTTSAAFIGSIGAALGTSSTADPSRTTPGAPSAPRAPGTAPLPPAGVPTSVSRQSIIDTASAWLGVPYAYGGNSRKGIDCSGLVQQVYAAHGVKLPRTSELQQTRGRAARAASAEPADLVFWGFPAHHVGIYMGAGLVLHAPHTGTVVRIESVDSITKSLPGSPATYRDVLPAPRANASAGKGITT